MRYRDNLENYICRTVTENPSYMQVKFKVPTGVEITAGEIFVPNEIDITERNAYDVFVPDTFSKNTDIPAIVLNNDFETMKDGRRPEGQPDYTQYVYRAGQVITAHLLIDGVKFELSPDNVSNVDKMEQEIANGIENTYLYPVANSSSLKWTKNLSDITTKVYLIIEGVKAFRLGGLFGADFAQTLVVRVKDYSAGSSNSTISINANVATNLRIGSRYVQANNVALSLSLEDADNSETYSWELTDYNGDSADNNLFSLGRSSTTYNSNGNRNDVSIKSTLTEAKTYKIYVKVSDSKGNSTIEGFDIPVAEATALSGITYSVGANYLSNKTISFPVSKNTVFIRLINGVGGYYPYTITLADSSDSNDNASFLILNEGNYEDDTSYEMIYSANMICLINTVELTEDKTYVIQIKVTDSQNNSGVVTFNMTKNVSQWTGSLNID